MIINAFVVVWNWIGRSKRERIMTRLLFLINCLENRASLLTIFINFPEWPQRPPSCRKGRTPGNSSWIVKKRSKSRFSDEKRKFSFAYSLFRWDSPFFWKDNLLSSVFCRQNPWQAIILLFLYALIRWIIEIFHNCYFLNLFYSWPRRNCTIISSTWRVS